MGSLAVLDGQPIIYPKARRDDSVVDNYHGFPIPDPYRWLEDPDSVETKEFVKNQVNLTNSVLEKCDDARIKIRERIKELFNHPRYTPPFKRGDCYFYWCNSGLQPQNVLYVQDSIDGKPEVLLDPNELSIDGTISLNIFAVSEDAQYLAYGLSSNGSDWVNIQVMTVNHRTVLPDYISWVKFSSIAWTHDSKGFFYSRFPTPNPKEGETSNGTETNVNLHHQLYYHYLGTDQSEDILCWNDTENPKHIFTATVTEDGKYVILYIEMGCQVNKKVYYLDLTSLPAGGDTLLSYRENPNSNSTSLPFIKFIDKFEASYNLIANDDTIFTFLTNKDAPRYKLTRVDITSHDSSWKDLLILPESDNNDVLESAHAVNGDKILVKYLSNVKCVLQLHDFNTGHFLQTLPIDIGTVQCISTRRKDTVLFIGFTSFLTPGIIYQYDFGRINPTPPPDQLNIFKEISVPKFDRTEFQVKQLFVPSKDGSTKIPAFVVARNDIVLDGSNPCLMFGYGGFNVKVTPCFSVARAVLLKHLGLVFVIANVRGGGEYGEEWHKAGSLGNKQNCFDDFVTVAEYLVDTGYTSPNKLCIEGGSNGGLLVGACINQRPDLFGCALAHVGVMDMLRYHKFTIGHAWTCDFGCSDNLEEFHWLIKYSPLHNVKRPWETSSSSSDSMSSSSSPLPSTNQYPATMLLTADHDNRVVPLHTLKMIATMQYVLCTSVERSPQTNPILARIECKAGHGCGRPTQKLIDEAADRYGFMATMLDSVWIEE